MLTSVIGGFLSSAGIDLYDVAKFEISVRSNIPLDFPQFMFLIVGIAGLTLIISDLGSTRKRRNRRKN